MTIKVKNKLKALNSGMSTLYLILWDMRSNERFYMKRIIESQQNLRDYSSNSVQVVLELKESIQIES